MDKSLERTTNPTCPFLMQDFNSKRALPGGIRVPAISMGFTHLTGPQEGGL